LKGFIHRTSFAFANENFADVLGCGNHFFSSGAHLEVFISALALNVSEYSALITGRHL
jgi:hypothetical protein